MNHIHGVAFRIIGQTFVALPTIEKIVCSGYSQRPDKATGQINDEYLFSVRVKRLKFHGSLFAADFSQRRSAIAAARSKQRKLAS